MWFSEVDYSAESPLAQGRELKSLSWQGCNQPRQSPLAQGRELKLTLLILEQASLFVAPRAGAGIEMRKYPHRVEILFRRPSRRGGN